MQSVPEKYYATVEDVEDGYDCARGSNNADHQNNNNGSQFSSSFFDSNKKNNNMGSAVDNASESYDFPSALLTRPRDNSFVILEQS